MPEPIFTRFSKIGERDHFRFGALYTSVWEVQNGELFKGKKLAYPLAKLRDLMRPYSEAQVIKKGPLDREYILIDLEDIESRTGRIKKGKKVTKIGSDKVLFGDADILFSKLRPYLGYAIINDKTKPYIGTTELIPFKVKNAVPEYIKYLMLTQEFLTLTSHLMYGKEHPRIDKEDLLNVLVPYPPKERQCEIVEKIKINIEAKVDSLRSKIVPMQKAVDDVFRREGIKKGPERQRSTIFQSSFRRLGEQKYMRLGSRYRYFWEIRKGQLFDDSVYPLERLGNMAREAKVAVLKKGLLDSEYIQVDLANIMKKEGRIKDDVETVTEIGSDKVVFGDSDVLYSQIDPFLGHVILNDESRPYIGTTELTPLKTEDDVDRRFIRYILLSQDFLGSSRYLMYGKRHPRIHIYDVMNLRIPKPSLTIQQKISDEIEKTEKNNIECDEKIVGLYLKLNDLLLTELSTER